MYSVLNDIENKASNVFGKLDPTKADIQESTILLSMFQN